MLLSILRDFNGNKFEARSFVGPCACDACKMEAFPILRCRDCDAAPGELHMDGCCVAECPRCKRQALCCHCEDWPEVEWRGTPYSHEVMSIAHRNGWFSGRVDTPLAPNGVWMWQPMEPGTPDSGPDVNLIGEYRYMVKAHLYRCILACAYMVKIRKWVARRKQAEVRYAPDGPGHLAEDLPAIRDLLS